jgi:hypothetical protein
MLTIFSLSTAAFLSTGINCNIYCPYIRLMQLFPGAGRQTQCRCASIESMTKDVIVKERTPKKQGFSISLGCSCNMFHVSCKWAKFKHDLLSEKLLFELAWGLHLIISICL